MNAPRLSALQLAWLQEIGLDKRMLAHFQMDAAPFPQPPPQQASSAQASPILEQRAAPANAGEGLQALPLAAAMASLGIGVSAGPGAADARREPSDTKAPQLVRGPMPHDEKALRQHMSDCQDCDLYTARSQVVFGSGHSTAPDWMVIGEAPGNRDDREGLPFRGKAGQLLQAMLAAIGIPEDAPVFFSNIVKCRPLGNRSPTREEVAACMPYLKRQIDIIQPARILVLGKLASQAVLAREDELDALRGKIHHLRAESGRDIPVVASYHPASLLMRPQHKIDAWRDLNLARTLL